MLQLLTETLAGLIKNREQQLILGGKVVMKQPRGDTGQVGNFLDGRGFNALLREDCIASGNQSCPIVRLVCPGFLLFCNCLVVHTNMITWKGTFVKRGFDAYSEYKSSNPNLVSFLASSY